MVSTQVGREVGWNGETQGEGNCNLNIYLKNLFPIKEKEKLTDTGIMNLGLKASSLVTSVGQTHQIWPAMRQNECLMNTQLFEQRWEVGLTSTY